MDGVASLGGLTGFVFFFFFSSRRRHTRFDCDWSSDVCSSDLIARIATEGLTPESVPAQGQRVVLRNNANLSTGGSATDVTDDVHPDIAARAVEAAQTIGLHICGVDVVCETMLRPLEEQNGGIVEVNAAPGLRMHLAPSFGKPRNVGVPMVDELFAPGQDGRDRKSTRLNSSHSQISYAV